MITQLTLRTTDHARYNLRQPQDSIRQMICIFPGRAVLCFLLVCCLYCSDHPTAVFVANAQPAVAPKPIRINVGGNTYTDTSGNLWQSDAKGLYLTTTTNTVAKSHCPRTILSTTNQQLYCSYRWFTAPSSLPYRYTIPVTNNYQYIVRLHFAELYFTKKGQRVFDIYIDDVLRTNRGFDILQNAEGNQLNTAYIFTSETKSVDTGSITIELRKRVENPALNGIEILPVVTTAPALPAPTPTEPVRINVGGDGYTDPVTGMIWKGDNNGAFLTTTTNSVVSFNCPIAITATTNDMLYCSYRYFTAQPIRYTIPVANNMKHIVRLHFAELYYTKIGQRNFDIYIENELRVPQFDILQSAKDNLPNTAYILTTLSRVVTDGHITIEFVRQIEHPSICGIEIIPYTSNYTSPTSPTTKVPVRTPTKAPVKAASPPSPGPPTVSNWIPYVIRINVGSTLVYTDANTGKVWRNDNVTQYAKGSSKTYGAKNLTQCSVGIQNTLEDRIYCTQRYYTAASSGAQYNVPVRTGSKSRYDIQLHFAEIYHVAPNQRVFSVYVEGTLVASNLDVYQRVGSNTSYVLTTRQDISDGYATIDFTSRIGQPFLSAVEVTEVPSAPSPLPVVPSVSAPNAPVSSPFKPPTVPVPAPKFQEILINCGGETYLEAAGQRTWLADKNFVGGSTFSDFSKNIQGTDDDSIYESERNGEFAYEIPVPTGSYEIALHFAEVRYNLKGKRLFNIDVEGKVYTNIDIFAVGGLLTAFTIQTVRIVEDGAVSIKFTNASPVVGTPKINGIAIKLVAPHYAHSVSNGPYVVVDLSKSGVASVPVDGSNSHTHGPGLTIDQWIWKKGSTILANGPTTKLVLPVGQHSVSLTVVDNGGNEASEMTTVTVLPFGYPSISNMTPDNGYISGNEFITIRGSGFTYTASETIVNFGRGNLTGNAIQVVNPTTIIVRSPPITIGIPVAVTVQTPLGTSAPVTFTYIATSPIVFSSGKLIDFEAPTVAAFGPDKKLYVATRTGKIAKFTMNGSFTKIISQVVATVAINDAILGIAFDPLDADVANPSVYCSASFFFHGESKSSSGAAINGRILKVSGANLDVVETVIKGLPVSDHDHGLNGLTFGDNGEMYIQVGSNTNGGLAGPLSGSQLQKENYFSSSTVVAELSDPQFDGIISYDKDDDGKPVSGRGIEVYAPGVRNSFSMVLHSNGYLYGTDNGPNAGYGKMMTGCGENEFIDDAEEDDRINLIQKGRYYGHPNPIRAMIDNDPRQCVWRKPTDPTSALHESALSTAFPSVDGIIEYEADCFDKQLRHNLIVSRYKNGLYRAILSPDGKSIIPDTIPLIPLVGAAGLGVTMTPNGNLIEVRLSTNSLGIHVAKDASLSVLQVKSVFPRRGGQAGGARLTIYGTNLGNNTSTVVKIGRQSCPIVSATATLIECTVPGGAIGTVDISVNGSAGSYVFQRGYRYISGYR